MKFLRAVLLVGCVASLGVAADIWNKETKSWDREAALKILFDSPWGKQKATAEEYRKDTTGGVSSSPRGTTLGDRQSDSGRLTSQTDRGEAIGSTFARVVWWSAKTPRRAYLRIAELAGQQITAEQRNQFAESQPLNIMIAFWLKDEYGNAVAVTDKISDQDLLKAAWLETPRQKKLMPVKAEVLKDGSNKPDRIMFEFPREADGQPTVTPQDKKIVFKWKLPKDAKEAVDKAKQFDVTFQPNKMNAAGQADI
jgi:hypothetical protein